MPSINGQTEANERQTKGEKTNKQKNCEHRKQNSKTNNSNKSETR